MTTLTPGDRARLRELAGKATPGPWRSARDRMEGYSVVESDHERIASTGSAPWSPRPVVNAAYIAAVDPATVTALLGDLDAAEAAVQRVREMHEPVPVSECTTACSCSWWSHADCPTVIALDGDA